MTARPAPGSPGARQLLDEASRQLADGEVEDAAACVAAAATTLADLTGAEQEACLARVRQLVAAFTTVRDELAAAQAELLAASRAAHAYADAAGAAR